jgi:hypothetical protein
MNTVKIVIGSWGSYNACNERALGSKWLDLSNYTEWDEIVEELKSEGFKLDGIDQELFVQDIEGIPSESAQWDYVHPESLFETLQEADVLYDEYKFDTMEAYLEVRTYDDFQKLVEDYGEDWDCDISLYSGYDWEDYGREMFEACEGEIDCIHDCYFDFDGYGRDVGIDDTEEYSGGLICIR